MRPLLSFMPGVMSAIAWARIDHLPAHARWRAGVAVQLAVVVAWLLPAMVLLNSAVYRSVSVSLLTLAGMGIFVTLPAVLRWTGSLRWTGAVFAAGDLVLVFALAAPWSGVSSPALAWLGFGLILATLIGGIWLGFGAAVVAAAAAVGLWALEVTGVSVPEPIARPTLAMGTTINLCLVAFLSTLLGGVIIRQQALALAAVERSSRELQQARQRAMISERLASVGRLAAGVAHEVNNPLAYVSANLHTLHRHLRGSVDDPELLQLTREARDGTRRIEAIVEQLARFARPSDDRKVAVVSPADAIAVALRILKATVAGAPVRVELESDRAVLAHEGELAQVLINLVRNAQQVSPEQGVVRVHVQEAPTREDRIWIDVIDEGPGIPEELRTRVLEPFFTTKPVGQGTGLGLSVCHALLERVRGDLILLEAPGGGACVRVELVAAQPGQTPAEPDPAPSLPTREPLAVLVVDDEKPLLRALTRMMRPHEVTACVSVAEARDWLSRTDRVDLILCDLMMPEAPGWALAEFLEQERPELADRVAWMTGGTFTPESEAFVRDCEQPVLKKPLDVQELRLQLARAAARRGA